MFARLWSSMMTRPSISCLPGKTITRRMTLYKMYLLGFSGMFPSSPCTSSWRKSMRTHRWRSYRKWCSSRLFIGCWCVFTRWDIWMFLSWNCLFWSDLNLVLCKVWGSLRVVNFTALTSFSTDRLHLGSRRSHPGEIPHRAQSCYMWLISSGPAQQGACCTSD